MKALPTTTTFRNVYIFKRRYKVLVSSGSYPACGPSCSCSSPPGIVSRSRSGRPWCCKCWRSLSPSAWPCSPPTVEAGTSAEGEGDSSAETLQLQSILSVEHPLLHPVTAVVWPCTFCQYGDKLVTLSIWDATAHLSNLARKIGSRSLLHGVDMCIVVLTVGASLLRFSYSYSPSVLSLCCPLYMRELNSISWVEQLWCCKFLLTALLQDKVWCHVLIQKCTFFYHSCATFAVKSSTFCRRADNSDNSVIISHQFLLCKCFVSIVAEGKL